MRHIFPGVEYVWGFNDMAILLAIILAFLSIDQCIMINLFYLKKKLLFCDIFCNKLLKTIFKNCFGKSKLFLSMRPILSV